VPFVPSELSVAFYLPTTDFDVIDDAREMLRILEEAETKEKREEKIVQQVPKVQCGQKSFANHPTYTLVGVDLTTHSSSLLGGRRRRYHQTTSTAGQDRKCFGKKCSKYSKKITRY
jgi:hypothetical protein